MDYIHTFNPELNYALSPLEQPVVAGLLRLFLVLYGSMIAPKLPTSILNWFQFVPFKIFVLMLILYTSNKDPGLSILLAVAFYTSMNVLAGRSAFEAFQGRQFRGH